MAAPRPGGRLAVIGGVGGGVEGHWPASMCYNNPPDQFLMNITFISKKISASGGPGRLLWQHQNAPADRPAPFHSALAAHTCSVPKHPGSTALQVLLTESITFPRPVIFAARYPKSRQGAIDSHCRRKLPAYFHTWWSLQGRVAPSHCHSC